MMKAIFIDNYRAHAVIESRIESFADWEIHGRRGDGIISPVTVIKSPDDRSVLLTYDRTPESTNLKATFESQFDDERAGLWFGDMLNSDNLSVFKEMGGGTVLYVDQAKNSPKTVDIFLQKMHSYGRLDQASLDALKPMLSPTQIATYENIIPTYEEIEQKKAEAKANSEYATYVYSVDENGNEIKKNDKVATEDVENNEQPGEYTGDDAFNNGLKVESGVDPESIDYNPEIMGSEDEPEKITTNDNVEVVPNNDENPEILAGSDDPEDIKPGNEYNLIPEGLRDSAEINENDLPDEIPEINSQYEKASNDEMNEYNEEPTESPNPVSDEINSSVTLDAKYKIILDGINTYLEKYNMTIDEFMESVFKLKFVLNQIAGGKVPSETTSADIEQDPTELNDSSNKPVEETPDTDNMVATSNPVTNLLNAVADEMNNINSDVEEVTPDDNTNNEETPDNSTNPDDTVAETISTESVNDEKELINQVMKLSNNDTEFFNNILPHKDKLSMETINEIVTTKMYDKILTGMTVYNMINIREDRARKLGLV